MKLTRLTLLEDIKNFSELYNERLSVKSSGQQSMSIPLEFLLKNDVYGFVDKKRKLKGGFVLSRDVEFRWKKLLEINKIDVSHRLADLKESELFEVSCLWKSQDLGGSFGTVYFWLRTILKIQKEFKRYKYFVSGNFNSGINKYYHLCASRIIFSGAVDINSGPRVITVFAYNKNDLLKCFFSGLIQRFVVRKLSSG